MEEILNSRMFRRKLQYLVKWEGYGIEGNTWEYSENLNHAPEKVTEFHTKNPGAPRRIRTLAFGSIPFRLISLSSASSRCSSRGGVIVRGTLPLSLPLLPPTHLPLPLPVRPLHLPLPTRHHSQPAIASNPPSLLTRLLLVLRWRAM